MKLGANSLGLLMLGVCSLWKDEALCFSTKIEFQCLACLDSHILSLVPSFPLYMGEKV